MAKVDLTKMDKAVLCGPEGKPLPVEYVEQKTYVDKEGNEKDAIVFGGVATEVLLNPYNPGQGSEPFPDGEVVPWEYLFPITDGDNRTKIKEINSAFMFEKPLMDGSETALRFFEEDEDSVVAEMKAKPVYVKVSAKPPLDPTKPTPIFFNLVSRSERVRTSDKAAYERFKSKLKKRSQDQDKVPF